MNTKQMAKLGIPFGPPMREAVHAVAAAAQAGLKKKSDLAAAVAAVVARPEDYAADGLFGALARELLAARAAPPPFNDRPEPAPWRQWGTDLDPLSIGQMQQACRLPVAVAGALMPDAHVGYGLPIGGVLATRNAVIPYAVGVDIACRMKLTVLDLPPAALDGQADRLKNALLAETKFGVGAAFRDRRQHPVMDEDWSFTRLARELKDKAWAQLGTSGSGNHFVEFGILTLPQADLGLDAGTYLALLSHSGSRGAGAQFATHYSRRAMELHPELPGELRHLAWLDLDREEGQEYWRAMELMGRYAAANHELIHRRVARHLGARVLLDLENHHNFAWRERHGGADVIVHRKGATPAGAGVLGIIPGSMAAPGYIVRGRGAAEALNSAAHGAGRRMSRKQAVQSFTWSDVRRYLAERNVTLLSAGLDEVPMAYKDIDAVMAAQRDLVTPVARFDPRLVRMAPAGERPED
ncbi:MAG TPA: RtcB family protein [Candidatus Sumerlaeota bacterium]|nr:RtcB family protein [Candidatus Sumerlaeota bacterium]